MGKLFKFIKTKKLIFFTIRKDIMTIIHIAFNKKVSYKLKSIILVGVVYILSPVDLIPEAFFNIIGAVDDIMVLPILTKFLFSNTPDHLLHEAQEKAENSSKKLFTSVIIFIVSILVVFFILGILVYKANF